MGVNSILIPAIGVALIFIDNHLHKLEQWQREHDHLHSAKAARDPDKPHRHAIWANHPVTRCARCGRDITDPIHNEQRDPKQDGEQ